MVRAIFCLLVSLSLPLWAKDPNCGSHLVETEVDEVLTTRVPLTFNPELHNFKLFKKGEKKFLSRLFEYETDYDKVPAYFWGGSRLLRFVPEEEVRTLFRYLNWYRLKQRQIQNSFRAGLIEPKQTRRFTEKFFQLEALVQRIRLVLLLSHIRLAWRFAERGAKIYHYDVYELLSINAESILTKADTYDAGFLVKFSNVLAKIFFRNGATLAKFYFAGKRFPKNGKIFSLDDEGDGREQELTFDTEDLRIKYQAKLLEIEEFRSFIESSLPLFIKRPQSQKRFAMVFGLLGFQPHTYEQVGELENVSHQAVQYVCERALEKIRKYLKDEGITFSAFQD